MTTSNSPCPWLLKAAAFLNEIGIPARQVDQVSGFLPNVHISKGELEYTASCDVSDLLHEAGHLATVPAQFRSFLDGDVSKGQNRMLKELQSLETGPDSPLYRAVIQCSDPEATAWGWAAGEHLGIPKELRILDHHFDGDGATQRMALGMGHHYGISGLSHAGFCVTRPALVKHMRRPAYPKLLYWAHPVIDPAATTFQVMPLQDLDSSPSP